MMQRILKGDTSGTIALALADGYNYAGCVVEFRYQGAVRTFRNCEEGQTIQFNLTAAETAVMALGAFPVTVRLFTSDGRFFTVNNADVKIEVTDCITDVREGGVIVVEASSGLYGVDDLPERYTTKDIRAKINEIIQRLGGGVAALCFAACVACGSLFGAGVTVQKDNLEDIHNDEKVVTGVTFDASGLATDADVQQAEDRAKAYADDAAADKITAGTATNVAGRVVSNVVTKAFVEGLGIDGGVQSVNGKTGAVQLNAGDVGAVPSGESSSSFTLRTSSHFMGGSSTAFSNTGVSHAPIPEREFDIGDVDYLSWDWLKFSGIGLGSWIYLNYVPTTRKVNGQPLTGDITIEAMPDNGVMLTDGALLTKGGTAITPQHIGAATSDQLATVSDKVEQSLIYSSGVYQYMTGNTNAWFSGTNYVTTADGTTRTQFVWEDGMDAGTVPCSMSLWEIRDGQKVVWDQRDWTVWYWNFKAAQLSNNLARVTGDLAEEVNTNCMKRGWAKYTAVRGLDNPDPSTLWIDTPKVQLMAGHQWEKIVEVGGAGYWTISGNGINLSQQDAESTFLTIKDFEGNACLTFRKTSSYLVYCQCGTDIVSNYMDAQNRVVFHLTTDVQPTAEFSTTLEDDSFVEQGTDGCPSNYEWTGSAGSWDCHFILKPGITAKACFARFKVMREGENVVEHTVPIKINGGIVFEQNGQTLKCKPVAQGTSVGSTVNWVIAQ